HRRRAAVLLCDRADLFADARLVAGVDLVRVLLDQLGVDLHLGRGEGGGELRAGRGRALGERCRGRRRRRGLRYRDRGMRRVRGRPRQGCGRGPVTRSRRRNRLVLLDPVEETHPSPWLKRGEVVLGVDLLVAHPTGRGDLETRGVVVVPGRCGLVVLVGLERVADGRVGQEPRQVFRVALRQLDGQAGRDPGRGRGTLRRRLAVSGG